MLNTLYLQIKRMHKKFVITIIAFIYLSIQFGISQSGDTTDRFKPYIGLGSAISNNLFTHGLEAGIYNTKAWYAVGFSTTEGEEYYGSFKAYYRIHSTSITDLFSYGSVSIALDKTKALSFEPGFAAVFNISKKFAPQVSLGLPIYEQTQLFNPVTLAFGISLNYWIR